MGGGGYIIILHNMFLLISNMCCGWSPMEKTPGYMRQEELFVKKKTTIQTAANDMIVLRHRRNDIYQNNSIHEGI